jgi:hypothetical protein
VADPVAITVSVLALAVSGVTAWLTLFRRGTVQMSQPTVIFFGRDVSRHMDAPGKPKVFLRTLLFATSKRGRVIQGLYVSVSCAETVRNFSIWVYGEKGELMRGSGLFVGETGVVANHHFLLQDEDDRFEWRAGSYELSVFCQIVGDKTPKRLFSQRLEITDDLSRRLASESSGLYFDWGPDSMRYLPTIDRFQRALLDKQD